MAGLKRFGIPLRTEDQAHRLRKGQLRYGERNENGFIVPNFAEKANIARMKSLSSEGYSLREIANVFNSLGISTKNKRGKWQATTIMKLIRRLR